MHFLITGGGGYLGSVLVPLLLENGNYVTVLDRFFWRKKIFASQSLYKNLVLIEADTRSFTQDYLKNIDVVIDLAALSNDPIAELNPQKTFDINFRARIKTAVKAKNMGVKRYILASSCSVYGFSNALLRETSKTAPLTTYAKASLLAEKGVLPLSDNTFCVTVLRQGTLYGTSPRMRFDLALNAMALSLFKENSITVEGGEQWRPIIHVKDSATAFLKVAQSPALAVNGQIFNVGNSKQNYQIKNLALLIAKTLNSNCNIITSKEKKDLRSYRVSFEKIKKRIGYEPSISAQDGAREVYRALDAGQITDSIETKTINWYKQLLAKNPRLLDVQEL